MAGSLASEANLETRTEANIETQTEEDGPEMRAVTRWASRLEREEAIRLDVPNTTQGTRNPSADPIACFAAQCCVF